MSKVLIDRELLERVQERLDPHRDAVLWGAVCDTFHTAPSGTPTMPVKAYYHEAPNEYGGLNKSVGLEVRKEFTDAPLVLEADALARIACLEGEIAKRDARIAEMQERFDSSAHRTSLIGRLEIENAQLSAELAALKAQEPTGWYTEDHLDDKSATTYSWTVAERWVEKGWPVSPLYAAPVSEAKTQGEYGDAYQGAREDLAIWKRRALEAEEKVLQQEQIIDHLTSEAQGESRFGEPVVTPDAPCVPDGYVLADKKALGTVLQALVNAPHHIRELQVTRQPVELFSDNPINVLIANYEAPASPAAPAADAGMVEALDYQALFDAIAAATSVYANGAINISVQAFRESLAAHSAKGVA